MGKHLAAFDAETERDIAAIGLTDRADEYRRARHATATRAMCAIADMPERVSQWARGEQKSWTCRIGMHDWVTWSTDPQYGWCQDFRCDKNTIPEFHPMADWGKGKGAGKPRG